MVFTSCKPAIITNLETSFKLGWQGYTEASGGVFLTIPVKLTPGSTSRVLLVSSSITDIFGKKQYQHIIFIVGGMNATPQFVSVLPEG